MPPVEHRRADAADPQQRLLVVDREASPPGLIDLLRERARVVDGVTGQALEADGLQDLVPLLLREKRQYHLAHGRAVNRTAEADPPDDPELMGALDDVHVVHDAAADDGEVGGFFGSLYEPAQVRPGNPAESGEVVVGGGDLEDTRTEPVAPLVVATQVSLRDKLG